MHTYAHSRHEHGQNFLIDPRAIRTVVALVARTEGPILEIGPGDGALTLPLQTLRRPLTAVEIDTRAARRLDQRTGRRTRVVEGDFLTHRLPREPHVVVGNLPFHLTTAILRRLLYAPGWTDAVLMTQWEVARRRAGVGGSTMMTAQWAPYYAFRLEGRIPASAYRPRPAVDGGLLTIARRERPLVPHTDRRAYAAFVHRAFTGPGRGMGQILQHGLGLSRREVGPLLGAAGVRRDAAPGRLTAEQWAALWRRAP
ncbi:23S ribosomal RNA methyltransferase Erm [Nesterenkonia sp. PF2B19]|uniref:23S ribosomal RNA methyltransferase Erm n=1 Tax=unclassified Nesterenkonia TaxID=2629769 RepID=UPI000A19DC36|nr:23S ribosomal RNA methyltransferase Erm [Nesterenkonia sp. PF2B19]OSM43425.1 23S ribosomal RNA methyltransferase Erm [Nesterenkonia sp. PF2B19]